MFLLEQYKDGLIVRVFVLPLSLNQITAFFSFFLGVIFVATFHEKLNLSLLDRSESTIVEHIIPNNWHVTYCKSEEIRGKVFKYIFITPSNDFTNSFNIKQEILVVFSSLESSFESSDTRDIEVIDKIYASVSRSRVSRVCSILISKDLNIKSKIQKLSGDPEQRVIVPFSQDELSEDRFNVIDLINQRFRDFFYKRDLFSFQTPLKTDAYFFGRNQIVTEILERHGIGEHDSLFGLRKIGKTSVIYAIQRRLDLDEGRYILIDCENPSIHKSHWYDLLLYIVSEYHKVTGSKVKLDSNPSRYSETKAGLSFIEDVLKIYSSKKKLPCLLILDEIEKISPNSSSSDHWRVGGDFIHFLQALRSLSQKYPQIFTFFIVGTNPNCLEKNKLNSLDNPFFSFIQPRYLPAFTYTSLKEMVMDLGGYAGLIFDEDVCAALHHDYGGHPFLVRQFCSFIHNEITEPRPVIINRPDYLTFKDKFEDKLNHFFDMILNTLEDWYPDEYEMLCTLAKEEHDEFEALSEDKKLIEHLIKYGLISVSKGNRYSFKIENMANYMINKHKYTGSVNSLTLEDMRTEISKRRNSLEEKLRIRIGLILKALLNETKAHEAILARIPESRRAKLVNIEYSQLMHENKSPLFFLDLINIIDHHWSDLANIFNKMAKSEVNFKLKLINDCRTDAHAKDISNDDFLLLRNFFTSFETAFE